MSAPASRRALLRAAAVVCCLAALAPPAPAQVAGPPRRLGLLVGCTEYPNVPAVSPLTGPGNDVPLIARLLTEDFGFKDEEITRLVGWPADESKRPTARNIAAAFEGLIKKAGEGTQVVILLGGHGVEVPIPESRKEPLDPRNPKLDGTDKIFLAADVKDWDNVNALQGAILDHQIGRWLDRLAAKGAAVWIMLDCCHSGTMARDPAPDDLVRYREVRPEALKISEKAYEEAARRARRMANKAGVQARGLGPDAGKMLHLNPRKKGSVVAFYACQPFEKAIEMPLPYTSDKGKGPRHGLMSYCLAAALKSQKRRLTYHELGQLLVAAYPTHYSGAPTPFCEGDLDREVLGLKVWPKRSILLEQVKGKLRVTAGGLHGLRPGSVLAVHPGATDKRDPRTVLGHVEVLSAAPGTAEMKPCAHAGKPAVPAKELPHLSVCTPLVQDLGDLRLKVAVGKASGGKAPGPQQAKREKNLAEALKDLPAETRQLVVLTADQARADWTLWVKGDKVQLREGDGRSSLDPREEALLAKKAQSGKPLRRRVFGDYDADNPREVAQQLGRDLRKIFTWQNVWRVAGAAQQPPDDEDADPWVKIELIGRKDPGGKPARVGPLQPGVSLQPGQNLTFRLKNESYSDLWITVLAMDANFGIDIVYSDAIKAQRSLRPLRFTVEGSSYGKEGIIVLAVPQKKHPNQPDYSFLKQSPLRGVEERSPQDRAALAKKVAKTPFERLMAAAAFEGPGTRSMSVTEPDNPAAVVWSWVTVPEGAEAAPAKKKE
jgi:hypothetical protein